MTCGIYMIQNRVNGKMYIGQSVDIEERWKKHKSELRGNYHINKHLQNAWNEYKEDNFEFTIICECDENQLNTMEEYYIFELMTYDRRVGYNKTYGGGGCRSTEETKQKISESNKGENNYMFGKHHSEEHKQKIRESLKGENSPWYGKHHSEETKQKMRENHANYKGENHPFYGKHHSEETKQKISESRKGKNCGKNNPFYGKHHSEETRKKISENNGSRRPEVRKKMSIPIVQLDPYTNKVVNVWGSATDAKREGGFHDSNINLCCRGRQKTHKGYKWQYLSYYISQIDPRIKRVTLFGKEYDF